MKGINLLSYKGYYGTVETSLEDNILFGKALGINGLISYEGETLQELREDFYAAIDAYLQDCQKRGVAPEKVYHGTFNVRIKPELHKSLALIAEERNQTLNATVEMVLANFVQETTAKYVVAKKKVPVKVKRPGA